MRHTERCKDCKKAIHNFIEKKYGSVEREYKFKISPFAENIVANLPDLQKVYDEISNYRGYNSFVKGKSLSGVDFYIPSQKIIIEYDESQHFTIPRKISLENYSKKIKLGFDKNEWIKRCSDFQKKDNDPIYRDEQRAWYDTIKDHLYLLIDVKPTIRIFSSELVWCSNSQMDIKIFEEYLTSKIT